MPEAERELDYGTLPPPRVVTERESEVGTGTVIRFPHKLEPESNAQGSHVGARARLAVTERGRKIGSEITSVWQRRDVAAVVRGRSVFSDPPESLAEHAAYLRTGGWSETPLLLVLGRAYGWLAWLALTPVLSGVWVVRRPSRLFVAIVVATIVWLTI
jgi:hypothetical protein